MNKLVLTVIALVSCVLLGCGKKDEPASGGQADKADKADKGGDAPASGGACDRRAKENLCGEYHGKLAKVDWVKKECEAMGAPYVAACPKDGAVGRCVRSPGTAQETQTVFYAPMTKETLTAMCSGGEVREP